MQGSDVTLRKGGVKSTSTNIITSLLDNGIYYNVKMCIHSGFLVYAPYKPRQYMHMQQGGGGGGGRGMGGGGWQTWHYMRRML